MRIEALEIDDHILEKIEGKHHVSLEEVEEAALGSTAHVRRGRARLYVVLGRSDAGRYLTVVIAPQGGTVFRVVTARDMSAGEKRIYQRSIRA